MSQVPLVDLRAQYHSIKPEIDAAIQRVLERGQFISGPEVAALEYEMAAYCGTADAVALNSGTDALILALRACGIGPGDEVITTACSFFATPEAIVAVGAKPVFVDIEPVTCNIDVGQLEAKITARTKAILPVHLYGHPAEMDSIMQIAQRRGVLVIEDCAQAIGATYHGKKVGTFGRVGCFSFFPSKNLGAYGDGGIIVTNDPQVAAQIRLLRVHGSRDRVVHEAIGVNSRLDELQAAILRVKLPHLDRWNQVRRAHAQTYTRLLQQAGCTELGFPQEQPNCVPVYHLYVLRHRQRDILQPALVQRGVMTQVHYPRILPTQPALAFLGHCPGEFPVGERLVAETFSLPLYPELTAEQIQFVVDQVAQVLAESSRPMAARS